MRVKHITAVAIAIISLASCGGGAQKPDAAQLEKQRQDSITEAAQKQAVAIFGVLPEAADPNSPMAILGRKLYFETALSASNTISCNSCHMLDKFGVDNLPTSPGHDGRNGTRNSPTVYNAWFHVAQFWDGRASDLTEQAKGPILNPIEMGLPNEAAAVKKIKEIKDYAALFAAAYPDTKDPITYQNIADAIAAYEKCLSTPSPFDRYMSGDRSALTAEQQAGMLTFINSGCITCHIGPGIGGSMFQKFGLINGPYWEFTKSTLQDKGKAEVTKNQADEYFFKVPSLRNITKTAPYFHDGSVQDLSEAVKIMAKTQLGKDLSDEETKSIIAFLESLTGELPAHATSNTQTAMRN